MSGTAFLHLGDNDSVRWALWSSASTNLNSQPIRFFKQLHLPYPANFLLGRKSEYTVKHLDRHAPLSQEGWLEVGPSPITCWQTLQRTTDEEILPVGPTSRAVSAAPSSSLWWQEYSASASSNRTAASHRWLSNAWNVAAGKGDTECFILIKLNEPPGASGDDFGQHSKDDVWIPWPGSC